jgi:hypothetical protein
MKPPKINIKVNLISLIRIGLKIWKLYKREGKMCLKKWFNRPERPFEYGNNCFLHFAINDYPGSVNDLRGCINDQIDLTEGVKKEIGGVSMKLFKDNEVCVSTFESEIRDAFRAMPTGLLTIGYSGHGTYDRDLGEKDGYREAFYFVDGKYSDKRLMELMKEKPEGLDVVIIADCCFSQGMGTRHLGNPSYRQPRFFMDEPMPENFHVIRTFENNPINFLLFHACAEDQTATDAMINGRNNGIYTYFLRRTLQKGITYGQWNSMVKQCLPSDQFEQKPDAIDPVGMLSKTIFEV